jgi:hypothetical protein
MTGRNSHHHTTRRARPGVAPAALALLTRPPLLTPTRPLLTLTLTLLMLLTPSAAPLRAQAAPRPCTYDTCALRVQAQTLTSPQKLVRGAASAEVVKLGLLEPAVAPFLALSDSAVAHAQIYDVLYDRGSIVSLTGTIIAMGAPILLRGTMQKIAFTGVGIGLSMYGGTMVNQANEALARAVWWYNRELPR